MIIAKVFLLILLSAALLCAIPAIYAFALIKKRPPRTLYERRAAQADFTPLSRIPPRQRELFLALEDNLFYTHRGFRLSYIRAALQKNLRAGKIVCGGSSITQQLAKNLYFRFTRSVMRKAAELFIAMALERSLGKERILEMYLNVIYFGNGVYGITDAAHFYFERSVSGLSLNQMFLLSCLPAIPTRGNPVQHPEVFARNRNQRLSRLMEKEPRVFTEEEAASIRSHEAACLDPDLRKPDGYTQSYPQTIPQVNERFGPSPQGIWKDMPYSNSPMAVYTCLSPNHSWLRTHPIDRITPHCTVGQYSVERLGRRFADPAIQTAPNYGIGEDGRVALYVEERHRSWCSSDAANDQRAVTIEEPFAFRETVYEALVQLSADICRRNGKKKLLWLGDKETALSFQPAEDEMLLTVHRWFSIKSCPGTWMYDRMGDLAQRVTAELELSGV